MKILPAIAMSRLSLAYANRRKLGEWGFAGGGTGGPTSQPEVAPGCLVPPLRKWLPEGVAELGDRIGFEN